MRTLALAGLLLLIGCSSAPQPRSYVLGTPADPVAGVRAETGRPVVELRTVSLPDYLDTSEILSRGGRNELKVSRTGQWGERLSVGIARALNASLARRLPGVLMTRDALSSQAYRSLLVDVDAFDIRPDGHCVLTAHWSVLGFDRRTIEVSERGTFVTSAPVSGGVVADPAIVAAMQDAVEQLADHIAPGLRRSVGRKP